MHVQNCLHPQVIYNKYTGEEVVGSCGHCAACLQNRANRWVTRLDMESSCHKYTWFCTFTYDEHHIDQIVRLRYDDYKEGIAYINSDTGEIYEFSDPSIKRHTVKDFDFCQNTKVLPILNKSDVQKFIKLVRYYIKQIDKNAILRYYYTGEIGPRTYRPHGHCLFWLDSEAVDKQFAQILSKTWKYGHIYDPHHVEGSAANYVASYINSLTDLPSIYQHRQLRPFHLFSKCPPLGSLVRSLEDVPAILDRKDTSIRIFSKASGKFFDVPLWRSLLDRYYPRIQRFSSLSTSDRIEVYRLAERHYFEDKYKFAEFLYFRYVRSNRVDWISRYLYDICHTPINRNVFSSDGRLSSSVVSDTQTNINSLVRLCGILLRCRAQASAFSISLYDYAKKISDFYDNIDKKKLYSWYEWQNQYFKSAPVKDFLLMDAAFVKRVNGKSVAMLSQSDRYYLDIYGILSDSDDIVHLDLDDCKDYREHRFRSLVNLSNLSKSKKVNDEVYSKKDNFNEILSTYLV